MTRDAKLMSGLLLLVIPTIQYGGYFLLSLLRGKYEGVLVLTEFQKAMFRAGHAHAGVLILLSLICQLMIDHATLSRGVSWSLRISFPLAAILMSGGFFFSAMGNGATTPNGMIGLLYAGALTLAGSLVVLGVCLIRAR